MALANYTDLKSSVASWLHHTGISTEIVDFITMAESRINRDLRLREMEEETDLTITASSRFADLPSNFQEPLALFLKRTGDSCRDELTKFVPEQLEVCDTTGEPCAYTIDGNQIGFNRPFDSTSYTVTLRYLKGWDIATDSTNWLLTNHPDVYLWAACMEGMLYLRDEARAQLYEQKYFRAKSEVQTQSRRNRKANLKSDIPIKGSSFQIMRGY